MDGDNSVETAHSSPPTQKEEHEKRQTAGMSPMHLTGPSVPIEAKAHGSEGPTLGQLHPAELSGASTNPKLQLMGIPRELRDNIFRCILLYNQEIYLDFDCSTRWRDAEHFYSTRRAHRGIRPNDWARMIAGNREEVCQKIEPVILQVCRQACEEGRLILYGENQWFFTHARAFETLLLDCPNPTSGAQRAALIRDLTIWPQPKNDMSFAEMPYTHFIEFVSTRLPALQHLQVVLSYNVFRDTRHWIHMTGLDHTVIDLAARITSKHPCLKKAVLSRLSGRLRYIQSVSITLRHFEVAFIVDILPVGAIVDCKLVEAATTGWAPEFEGLRSQWLVAKDIILDCPKIRATPPKDIPEFSALQYALADTATSSEPLLDPSHSPALGGQQENDAESNSSRALWYTDMWRQARNGLEQ